MRWEETPLQTASATLSTETLIVPACQRVSVPVCQRVSLQFGECTSASKDPGSLEKPVGLQMRVLSFTCARKGSLSARYAMWQRLRAFLFAVAAVFVWSAAGRRLSSFPMFGFLPCCYLGCIGHRSQPSQLLSTPNPHPHPHPHHIGRRFPLLPPQKITPVSTPE